jgi:hypothetical protein
MSNATGPNSFQLVVSSTRPHELVRFWAAAMGYDVEDHSDLIRSVAKQGLVTDDDYFEADGQLWWNDLAAMRDPSGTRPRFLFQRTDAEKTGRNRWHIDINVGRDGRAAEVERLEELGASILWEIDDPGSRHTTMADPDGNEFCVQ